MKFLHRNQLRLPSTKKVSETLELARLGEQARIVFHDLSNHLTALTLSVGHLEEGLARDTERLREYSKQSERARIQMEHVAKILRSYIENSTATTFNPREEITQVVQAFSARAVHEKTRLIFEPQSEPQQESQLAQNAQIFGNKNAFIHIVTNLISNALDSFKTVGNKRMRRVVIALENSDSHIQLTVSDTGCGIKNCDIGKIFNQKFTTKPGGHGIGLSATKDFVERDFHGTITAKSCTKGTAFLVTIPNATPNTYVLKDLKMRTPSEVRGTSIL